MKQKITLFCEQNCLRGDTCSTEESLRKGDFEFALCDLFIHGLIYSLVVACFGRSTDISRSSVVGNVVALEPKKVPQVTRSGGSG